MTVRAVVVGAFVCRLTWADSCCVWPVESVTEGGLATIDDTRPPAPTTVTVAAAAVAGKPAGLAMIVATPTARPVTTPLVESTVAMFGCAER